MVCLYKQCMVWVSGLDQRYISQVVFLLLGIDQNLHLCFSLWSSHANWHMTKNHRMAKLYNYTYTVVVLGGYSPLQSQCIDVIKSVLKHIYCIKYHYILYKICIWQPIPSGLHPPYLLLHLSCNLLDPFKSPLNKLCALNLNFGSSNPNSLQLPSEVLLVHACDSSAL